MTVTITEQEVLLRRRAAEQWHRERAGVYAELAEHVHNLLLRELRHYEVVAQAVSHRAKTLRSLQDKWVRPSDADPAVFKYDDPSSQITDVAAVRVVTYLQHLVPKVQEVIASALSTTGPQDRAGLDDPSVPGYRGVHYLVELPATRLALREYEHLSGLRAEVQVQTVLQHAWAEIQHDVLYKNSSEVPADLKRRLVALAGMLELADAEFRSVAQQLAVAQDLQADGETDPAGPASLDAVQLRGLLHRHLGGADRLDPLWLDQLLALLAELDVADTAAVEQLLTSRADQVDAVRDFLQEPGYEAGPVEVLDALFRLELGERYFTSRSGWSALDDHRRGLALDRSQRLAQHVTGSRL